jgi:hypothetical protein
VEIGEEIACKRGQRAQAGEALRSLALVRLDRHLRGLRKRFEQRQQEHGAQRGRDQARDQSRPDRPPRPDAMTRELEDGVGASDQHVEEQ